MTQAIVLFLLVVWVVVIPLLVVGLRLRRARFAEAAVPLRRLCEGRRRLAAAAPSRARAARVR
jgi:Flp pilus assembly protein protease CpaA